MRKQICKIIILSLYSVSGVASESIDDFISRGKQYTVGTRSRGTLKSINKLSGMSAIVNAIKSNISIQSVCGVAYMDPFSKIANVRMEGDQSNSNVTGNSVVLLIPNTEIFDGVTFGCEAVGDIYEYEEGNPNPSINAVAAPRSYALYFTLSNVNNEDVIKYLKNVIEIFPEYEKEVIPNKELKIDKYEAISGLYMDGKYQNIALYQFSNGFILGVHFTLGIEIKSMFSIWEKLVTSYFYETNAIESKFNTIGFSHSEDPSLLGVYSVENGMRIRLKSTIGSCIKGSEWESIASIDSTGNLTFLHHLLNAECTGIVREF